MLFMRFLCPGATAEWWVLTSAGKGRKRERGRVEGKRKKQYNGK